MPDRARTRLVEVRGTRLTLELVVRPYARRDLEPLEWFGAFTTHRAFVAAQFERHLRGENVMLVAAHRGFPVGQVWIDLVKASAERTGLIWALRVLEPFQGLGIARHLLAAAEERAFVEDLVAVELGAEKHQPSVRAFYERLGYLYTREEISEQSYVAPDGSVSRYVYDQWILRKMLAAAGPS